MSWPKKYITVFVIDEDDKKRLAAETGKRENINYDYYVFKLPKDPEFWESGGKFGIRKAKSFLQTPRGERWILNKFEQVASKYSDLETPKSYEEIEWWHV